MCGRYVITSPPEAIRKVFKYAEQPNFPARYNIAPTQPVPVVCVDHGVRRFQLMKWAFLPAWAKDPAKFGLVINARAETVLEKPAFKNAIRRRRCLLPADGYYEWQARADGKQPFFVAPKNDQPVGFAGLTETWVGPNGEEIDTVAILTCAASDDMAHLHHRAPVVIQPGDHDRWLDGAAKLETALDLLRPPRETIWRWHEVSTAVNRVANDDPSLIVQVEPRADETEPRKPLPRKKPVLDNGDQGSLF